MAIMNISAQYFQIPIANKEKPIYIERVYCYELYHQMRKEWDEHERYQLCGELDKSGHPLIRNNILDKSKPDFLVHEPGNMDGNLLVIEVKPVNARKNGLKKDLETLTNYHTLANYSRAILLIYGDDDIAKLKRNIMEISKKYDEISLELIEIYWHKEVGREIIKIEI